MFARKPSPPAHEDTASPTETARTRARAPSPGPLYARWTMALARDPGAPPAPAAERQSGPAGGASGGEGQPLDPATRAFFEGRFGRDLGGVRLHAGARAAADARSLRALAFTIGRDISFAEGRLQPGTREGQRLLAHELTHVLQQTGSDAHARGPAPGASLPVSQPGDPAERDAERAADAISLGQGVGPVSPAPPQVHREEELHTGDLVVVADTDFTKNGLQMARDLGSGKVVATLARGALLKLGDKHPQGGGAVFYATVMKSEKEPYPDAVGVVRTGWVRRAAAGDILSAPAPVFPAAKPEAPAAAAPPVKVVFKEGDFVVLRDQGFTKDGLDMAKDLGSKERAGFIKPGTLLKLGKPHPQGGGEAFHATVMTDRDTVAPGSIVGIVRTDWIRPAPPPAPATPAAAPGAAPPVASVSEILTRYRLVDTTLDRLAKTYETHHGVTGSAALAKKTLAENVRSIEDQYQILTPDDQERHSAAVDLAITILDRVEKALPLLFAQLGAFAGMDASDDAKLAYQSEVNSVIELYAGAIEDCLAADAVGSFDHAEAVASGLPRAIIEVDLAHFAAHPAAAPFVEPRRNEMIAWVTWVRGELDKLGTEATAVREARQNKAGNLAALEADLQRHQEIVELSIQGIGFMEQGLRATEYLIDQGTLLPSFYGGAGRVLTRCVRMKEAAEAGDLEDLRKRVTRHATDPEVIDYYKGLPLLAFGSRFAASLAITFVAAYVAAGAAALVMGSGTGAAAGGATALSTVGGVAVEALAFTLVSRGLSSAIPGHGPNDSFLADLLWNLGLFSVLKGVSAGVTKALAAKGLPALAGVASAGAAFPVLQVYGALRHRLAKGQWPGDGEMATMTSDNILMLAALTAGMRAMTALRGTAAAPTALGRFHSKYGGRFEVLDAGRRALEERLMELGKETGPVPKEKVDEIRDKARVFEEELNKVLDEAKADKDVDLAKIREELKAAGKAAPEGASELLEREVGILSAGESVGLRGAGGPRSFSYKWGSTSVLVEALHKSGATVSKEVKSDTGLRTITAEIVKGEPPVVFQERPETGGEHGVDIYHPDVQKLLSDFDITVDPAVRVVQVLLERELARAPKPQATVEERLSGPLQVVRKYLGRLRSAGKGAVEDRLIDLGENARVEDKPRVDERVKGLYEGVKLAKEQGDWTFEDTIDKSDGGGGTTYDITTAITLRAPDGNTYTGSVNRTIRVKVDPATQREEVTLTMGSAFLDEIPKEYRWVVESDVHLIEGQGIPLQTYATIRQMKLAQIGVGEVTKAKMSIIVNSRAILELASLKKKHSPGVAYEDFPQDVENQLVLKTQAGQYAATNIVQSGKQIASASVTGGSKKTAGQVARGSEYEGKLDELGLTPDDPVKSGFNIDLTLGPEK